jgi:hypothetical protein
MDRYKLSNVIKKEMLKDSRIKTIKKQRFSFKSFKQLCQTYRIDEWTIWHYCCKGEDQYCWIDAESSWVRCKGFSDKEINMKIYVMIKRDIIYDYKDQKNIGKINVFIGESDDTIFLCIPTRDKSKCDHWVCFNKSIKV